MFFMTCFASVSMAMGQNVFYGSVTINGKPAPDGIEVQVRLNGLAVATESTYKGTYGYPIGSFYIEDMKGKSVQFFVNNIYTNQSLAFCGNCKTNINLNVNSVAGTGLFLGIPVIDFAVRMLLTMFAVAIIVMNSLKKKPRRK
jgi:hypothetical protein